MYVCIAEYFFVAILCARKNLLFKQGLTRGDFYLKIVLERTKSHQNRGPFRAKTRVIRQQSQQLDAFLGAEWQGLGSQLIEERESKAGALGVKSWSVVVREGRTSETVI